MKISFLCFDLAGNSLGRAALLAGALAKHHEVELIGPQRGDSIWYPLKDAGLPVRAFPWKRYPAFGFTLRDILRSIDGDVLFACKLRPTSFGAGLLKQWQTNKPLIVDIDDWELGFFYHTGFWGRVGRFLNLSNPNGLPWTWLMEQWVGRAGAVTVSNRFLQDRFGGELLYHCRDTSILDPARFDPHEVRKQLGLEGKKIVMFLGTPRGHKGVDDLLSAMGRLRHPQAQLVFVGADARLEEARRNHPDLHGRVTLLPRIPFSELGRYLSSADVVAIPQRRTTDTAGQMPAKIFDAMAMAKPIVSTRVSDIPEVLGDCGYLADPGDVPGLAESIGHVLIHPEEAREKGRRARERCVRLYDIQVLEQQLLEVVEKAVAGK